MEVNSVVQSSTAAVGAKRTSTVDYEAFLHLLMAQLKNQDPTNPSDGAEFLSQLASFSSVEQGVQTNSKLDALIQQSLLSEADKVMGRHVVSADGTIGGAVRSVSFDGDSLVAHLDNGRSLPLSAGVIFS